MSVKLSIVIPVYNAEKYIRACLDSLCGQSLKEIEIICVNDGSTDNSLKILQEYAQKDKRVIIADQENKGANAARKAGYLCSSGEYFTLVDADDWLEPNLYETVIKKMEQENADCGVFNWYVENGKAQRKVRGITEDCLTRDKRFIYQISLAGLCGQCNPMIAGRFEGWPWNKVYKRKIFEKLDRKGKLFADETRHFEDALNNIRLFQFIDRLLLLNQYGYHYRKEDSLSLTTRYFERLPPKKDFVHYMEFARENSLDDLYILAVNAMTVNLFWDYLTKHHYFHKNNPDSFRKQMREIKCLLTGECMHNCYFPIREALEKANPDWINNRVMRFLVRHQMASAVSLYAASRISLARQKIVHAGIGEVIHNKTMQKWGKR